MFREVLFVLARMQFQEGRPSLRLDVVDTASQKKYRLIPDDLDGMAAKALKGRRGHQVPAIKRRFAHNHLHPRPSVKLPVLNGAAYHQYRSAPVLESHSIHPGRQTHMTI